MFVETKINLDLDQLVKIIKSLSKKELKTLEEKLFSEEEETELKRRLSEVKSGKAKLLSKKEVFQ
ncbi:MAG TPA: hypothetical protein PKK26_03485 [Candidatus Wallbacteria bacterium]|nr:hypothetical protein [Candidatus Wallbacteria bacterium]